MSAPVVSVVMSVYNGAAYLSETIDSVFGQTEHDFEFIIVNDGSTDTRVGAILDDYARRDSRIRLLFQANAGLTRALRAGCGVARGTYIARVDVGDVMLPERLCRQRSVLDTHPDVVLATCWTAYCGPEWEPLYTAMDHAQDSNNGGAVWIADVLPERGARNLTAGPTSHPSVMIRHDAYRHVGGYRSEFYYGQDWDLWFRLAEHGPFGFIREVLYRVRLFPDSISALHHRRQAEIGRHTQAAFAARLEGRSEVSCLDRAAAIRPGGRHLARHVNRGSGSHFIGELLRKNGDVKCRRYFLKALKQNPVRIVTVFRLVQSLAMKR